jgi:hypothetical protein
VAILILFYFFLVQNLFHSRKNQSKKRGPNGLFGKNDMTSGSLFMNAIDEIFEIELEKKQALFEQQLKAQEASEKSTKNQVACEAAIREMLVKHKVGDRKKQVQEVMQDQIFIVMLLSNLKRMGEGVLRWSFFTLNVFILSLYMCSNTSSVNGGNSSACPPGVTCIGMGYMPVYPSGGDDLGLAE